MLGLVGGAPGTLTRGRLLLPSVLQPLACLFQNMAAARSCVPRANAGLDGRLLSKLASSPTDVTDVAHAPAGHCKGLDTGLVRPGLAGGWWRVYDCFYAI